MAKLLDFFQWPRLHGQRSHKGLQHRSYRGSVCQGFGRPSCCRRHRRSPAVSLLLADSIDSGTLWQLHFAWLCSQHRRRSRPIILVSTHPSRFNSLITLRTQKPKPWMLTPSTPNAQSRQSGNPETRIHIPKKNPAPSQKTPKPRTKK